MSVPSSLQNLDQETLAKFRAILEVTPQYVSPEEEGRCHEVAQALSEDECFAIATTSYAFWALKRLEDPAATLEVAVKITKAIARWHWTFLGPKAKTTEIVDRLKEAIALREEHKLNLYRTCFDKDATSEEEVSMREDILAEMGRQVQVLKGQDKAGRAVLFKLPRTSGGTTEESYTRIQLYVAERSAAVTEFLSAGTEDTVCAIFSLKGSGSGGPPLSWQLATVKLAQKVYPGRMGKVLILDAAFMARQIFNVIRPFLSSGLKETTAMVTGKEKAIQLAEVLEDPDVFADNGSLKEPVDIERFLTEVPFYSSY